MPTANRNRISSPSFFIGQDNEGLISFGSGQPDLPPPTEIFHNIEINKLFKYGAVQGEIKLRKAIAYEYQNSTPEDFVITNGASEALDLTFRSLFELYGSVKILVGRPYYYSYPEIIKLAGHHPVYLDLKNGKIDMEDFRGKVKGVKVVLINSPSNPTGRIENLATLREIEHITKKCNSYVISDEVYKDLIYKRNNYLINGSNVITINSFSKTYSMCGLRVGYLYSKNSELVKKVVDIKTHTSMNTNIISQEIALKAMHLPDKFIEKQAQIWEQRKIYTYNTLLEMGFSLWKPEGAFYVFPKINNSGRVVSDLYFNHNVIVYDGAWFGAPNRIRLSYALEIPKIEEGLARIKDYIKDKKDWL